MDSPTSAWFPRPPSGSDRKLRLLCFPHAGGASAVFHGWSEGLPGLVEVLPVRLPGHTPRLRETPLSQLSQIVAQLIEEIKSLPPLPTALFGHSFGGLLAFELARSLQRSGKPPAFLCLSASRPPHLPISGSPLHDLPDQQFIAEIGKLDGTPPEALEHAELMVLVLPGLRADFTALETYKYQEGPKLSCPIVAIGGQNDPLVTKTELEVWQEHTSASFQLHILPDGHHLLVSARDSLLGILTQAITGLGFA